MKSESFVKRIELKDRNGRVVGTKDVVTYQGLLSKVHEAGLKTIRATLVQVPSNDNGQTAIAKVEVTTEQGTFEAFGDASPESVNSFIVPHLIRVAETRAKARAFRDAVNIGLLSFEELDGEELPEDVDAGVAVNEPQKRTASSPNGRTASPKNGSPRLPSPLMTENQRRYLFRLLATQGLEGDAAHAHLKAQLGVESLLDVTRVQATAFIEELLKQEENDGVSQC